MISAYDPCPCKSGKKFKFCCHTTINEKSSSELLKMANIWPISKCWRLYEVGNPHKITVFVVRSLPNGKYILGSYLLDLLSLGVKDAFMAVNISKSKLAEYEVYAVSVTKELISYQDARSLILGSLAFAKKHGYAPHDDWEESKYMVEPNDPYEGKFTFGLNGKSLYIQSIYDMGFEQTSDGMKVIIEYT